MKRNDNEFYYEIITFDKFNHKEKLRRNINYN